MEKYLMINGKLAHNRSKALEHAYNKTDYLMIFDADDEICGDIVIPSPMTIR